MDQYESYQLSFTIKELKLSVKFPCRLTFQYSGKALTSEIQSNGTNHFLINKDINLKEQCSKEYLELNINLATEKGGNIMAGIIKINLKDFSMREQQTMTLSLQKCLDPYATCTIFVKSIKLNRSRTKKINLDQKGKNLKESLFQTKSQAPMPEMKEIKSRLRFNEVDTIMNKRNTPKNAHLNLSSVGFVKEKAMSTIGGYRVKDSHFDRQELGSKYKHLNRKIDEEQSKTVVTGKWKQTDQIIKNALDSNEKSLKTQISKYKTKFEQSQRNLQQKHKQNKQLKDQISDLNRQITQKNYLLQELNIKNNQITKLDDTNRQLSRNLHEGKNKIIDLQKEIIENKNQFQVQFSRVKEETDRKEHENQKLVYEKQEEIRQILEENQYKVNQIKKMKGLIQDLQRNLQIKMMEFEKVYNNQRNEHNKTKSNYENKLNNISSQLKNQQNVNYQGKQALKISEEQCQKITKKLRQVEQQLRQTSQNLAKTSALKYKFQEQKIILIKVEQQLSNKIKILNKQTGNKQKTLLQLNNSFEELNNSSKKKISELMEKNKVLSIKNQELENKNNQLSAAEEKLKRSLQLSQKQLKSTSDVEKNISKNLKLKEDKILDLQKQLYDTINKSSVKDSMNKKQIQSKVLLIQKLSSKNQQLQKSLQKQKESNEQKRQQLLKYQSRSKGLQQINAKLSQNFKQERQEKNKKQNEFQQARLQFLEQIKLLQTKLIQYNKELHHNELQKMNTKNQLNRLQKFLENQNQKLQKSKKQNNELENKIKLLLHQIQIKNEEIIATEDNFKNLQNDYKLLYADKSKNQKINNIINQEKEHIKNDINKLKKEIQKRDIKEEQYLAQIKAGKEQINKSEMKLSTVLKEFQKFKHNISQSVRSIIILKQNFLNNQQISQTIDVSRALNRSRINKNQQSPESNKNQHNSQLKLGQIIEKFAKEIQQTITLLNEDVKKIKKQKDLLEKQMNSLTIRSKERQQQLQKTIQDRNYQLQSINSKSSEYAEQYQEKIQQLQRLLEQKNKETISLSHQLNEEVNLNQNIKMVTQSNINELVIKCQSLKHRMHQVQRQNDEYSSTISKYEQHISSYELVITEFKEEIHLKQEQMSKKQKIILSKEQQVEETKLLVQNFKKIKSQLSLELINTKENLNIQKQNKILLQKQIKQEQFKNLQLKDFNSELIKQKEILLKRQAQKNQKISYLQNAIDILTMQKQQKHNDIQSKDKLSSQLKQNIKKLQLQDENLNSLVNDLHISLQKQKERVKEKEKKITEKDMEIQNINNKLNKLTQKNEQEIKHLTQQTQNLTSEINKMKYQSMNKVQDLENQIKTLKANEIKINQANLGLQEEIYFQKQTNSLNHSKIQELKHQIMELELQTNSINTQMQNLHEELKYKQETLFSLSGKLYASDNRLQNRQDQFKSKLQKVENDWRYRIQDICQEYQNKLEIMERQKNYVKMNNEEYDSALEKIEHERLKLMEENEKERQTWQAKIKHIQAEKLNSLVQKNKQIEKIRQMIEGFEQTIKKQEFQYKIVEEEKKKLQEKLKQHRAQMLKADDRKNQTIRNLEKQIDQVKRKEGQFKRFKQALKNNQWTIQRQLKKNIQFSGKNLMNYTLQQNKSQVHQILKVLQTNVCKLALPDIDSL